MKLTVPMYFTARHTRKLLSRYRSLICKHAGLSEDKHKILERIAIESMGYFDKSRTYCGRGDSGDKVVPDLWFRFAGWFHDGLSKSLIEDPNKLRLLFPTKCDDEILGIINKHFKAVNYAIAGECRFKRAVGWVYWKFVDWFYKQEDIEEERSKLR